MTVERRPPLLKSAAGAVDDPSVGTSQSATQQSKGGRIVMDRKKKIVIGIVTVITLGAGAAAALWSASGTGSGTARSVSAQTITVTASTGAADLFPGSTGGDVHFTLNNPNPYPVTFTSLTAGTITSSDQTACPAANVSVPPASGFAVTVGANTTATQSIPNVVTMDIGAPDGCQAKAFTIALTLTGMQS
jgi:hypothetical protein